MQPSNASSSIRKAALLVVGLEPRTADALLAQMPPRQAERIREAVATLGAVDPAEQQAVIEEFYRIGPFNTERTADRGERKSPPPTSTTGAKPFAFLQHYGAAEIAEALTPERPQTIAVVLAHLSPRQAADVLARLSPQLRGDVVGRMVRSDTANSEIVSELEAGLRTSLQGMATRPQLTSGGVQAVRSILAAADRPLVDGIISLIARRDQILADRLRPESSAAGVDGDSYQGPLAFDRLVELDDVDLDTVLHTLDAEVLALALTGCEQTLLDRILHRLPPAERRRFRRSLDHLGPTRLSDVEAARRNIGMLARQLADQEQITLPGTRRRSVAA